MRIIHTGLTFFTELWHIDVVLSPAIQPRKTFMQLGIESIPSESECYPAKLSPRTCNSWLIKPGRSVSFFALVFHTKLQMNLTTRATTTTARSSHPMRENIKNNVEELADGSITVPRIRSSPLPAIDIHLQTHELVRYPRQSKMMLKSVRDSKRLPARHTKNLHRTRQAMSDLEGERNVLKWMAENGTPRHCACRPPVPHRFLRSTTVFRN